MIITTKLDNGQTIWAIRSNEVQTACVYGIRINARGGYAPEITYQIQLEDNTTTEIDEKIIGEKWFLSKDDLIASL